MSDALKDYKKGYYKTDSYEVMFFVSEPKSNKLDKWLLIAHKTDKNQNHEGRIKVCNSKNHAMTAFRNLERLKDNYYKDMKVN